MKAYLASFLTGSSLIGVTLLPACAKSSPGAPDLAMPAVSTVADAPRPVPAASTPLPPGSVLPADEWVGKPAPDFSATAQDGKVVHLADLRGKPVVVYFYPKDETPGCTKEACSFRDSWQAIAKTGAFLVGISGDGRDSHKAFAEHYSLPFLLLSDPDGAIGRRYGVPFNGHHQRQTFVIGADGAVRNVYRTVDVSTHAAQVLDALTHAG